MKKVFLCEDIHVKAYQLLEKHFEIIQDKDRLFEADALITRNMPVSKHLIEQCLHLKVVAIHGTGYDHVDVSYLKEKGITVFHVPYQNALSVAELTVGLILDLSRKITYCDHLMHKQCLPLGTKEFMGHELSHKTLGLIGFGSIAQKVAAILQNGFSMSVVVYSPHLQENKTSLDIEICQSVEEVFEKADIVSLHCALNEKTKHMINLDVFQHAKKNCLLINTSRGAVVCEDDLYFALKQKFIAGAASDVFENEPISPDHPLLTLPNFIATCHIGASSDEALLRVGMHSVQGLLAYFSNQEIAYLL